MARKTPTPKATPSKGPKSRFEPLQVDLGDKVRVERRFIVDGELTTVEDRGVFHGVQAMGSVEHLLLETKGEVRLIPIPSISEIVLEGVREKAAQQQAQPGGQGFDPSFA